jgi:glutamate mutase epsilon subunit
MKIHAMRATAAILATSARMATMFILAARDWVQSSAPSKSTPVFGAAAVDEPARRALAHATTRPLARTAQPTQDRKNPMSEPKSSRPASIAEINDLHRKLVKKVSEALDGDFDKEGVRRPPTASVLNVARQLISDAKVVPSQDVEQATRHLQHAYLPFAADGTEAELAN